MNFTCLEELSDLDRTGLIAALIVAAILFLIGLFLMFRLEFLKVPTTVEHGEKKLTAPFPFFCLVASVAVLGGIYWWLNNAYPADSIIFKDKAWTLAEIKSRLESVSREDVQLEGNSASFAINKDRPVSGACAADVLKAICDDYRDQLICRNEPGRTLIERKP